MFKINNLWVTPRLEKELKVAQLLDIESVSQREFDWFEAPNRRRGGWSGVTRIVLNPEATEPEQKAVFLKIQQNHFYVAPNTCFRKRLTFEREFMAMQALGSTSTAIPEVVMFAQWEENGNQGAILVTESLDDWLPLNAWLQGDAPQPAPDRETLRKALEAIAQTAREINQAGWIHMCFSAKHLFVRPKVDGSFETKIVDWEKSRKRIGSGRRSVKDCSHFMRHTPGLSDEDKLFFLKAYFQTDALSAPQKTLIQKMRGSPDIS